MAAISNKGELYFTVYHGSLRADRIEPHFLPGHSPELNPVELLNADTKRHVAQANPGNKHELAALARTHLRRRQNQPDRVRAFFGKKENAACPPLRHPSLACTEHRAT